MPELDDLSTIPSGNISDDDYLLIFDVATGNSYKITKSKLLEGIAYAGGDHNFGTSTITSLTAPTANISTLNFVTGSASLTAVIKWTGSIDFGSIADGVDQSITQAVTGALVGDFVLVGFGTGGLNKEVSIRAYVAAADTVKFDVVNSSGGSVSVGSVSLGLVLFRFS